jgi:site-specific DNA-methyltransferase (adenine-specific)
MLNQIFNESNLETMGKMPDEFIDGIICSPPYNIGKKRKDFYYNTGYNEIDNLTTEQYLETRVNEFKEFSRILKNKGVICYNLSYFHQNPILPTLLISQIHQQTDLTLADIIYWKKSNAIPFQTSPNKLSRIIEPIYIIVHKDNINNFKANKKISKVNKKTGQIFYKNYNSLIEAKNNDGFKSPLKAVYSTELVKKIIQIYFPQQSLIYDPFMGSGTTACACIESKINYIGSEIKFDNFKTSEERIKILKEK